MIPFLLPFFFFFNDTATTEIYTLSLHDALPVSPLPNERAPDLLGGPCRHGGLFDQDRALASVTGDLLSRPFHGNQIGLPRSLGGGTDADKDDLRIPQRFCWVRGESESARADPIGYELWKPRLVERNHVALKEPDLLLV